MQLPLSLFFLSAFSLFGQEIWTLRAQPDTSKNIYCAAGRQGLYFFGGVDRSTGGGLSTYSRDGITWSDAPIALVPVVAHSTPAGVHVASTVGIWHTLDGVVFTRSLTVANMNPSAFASNGSSWVLVTEDGFIYRATSVQGPWTKQLSPSSYYGGVAFGNGIFLASASGNSVVKSVDGVLWVDAGIVFSDRLRGFGGGVFFGRDYRISSSFAVTQIQYQFGYPSAAGPSSFLAIGFNGEVGVSSNLDTWTRYPAGITGYFYGAAFCGDLWIAASYEGRIVTSPVVGAPALAAPPVAIKPAIELSWPSITGRQYQVQGSLNNAAWTNVGLPLLGNGSTLTFTAQANETRKFFRVEAR